MDWENHLEKNPIQKIENCKNQSEIAACEQKTTSEKPKLSSNTVFSLLKIWSEQISRRKTIRFFAPLPVSA